MSILNKCYGQVLLLKTLPKSLKYNLPPSLTSKVCNLSSSFKDFPPYEIKKVHMNKKVKVIMDRVYYDWVRQSMEIQLSLLTKSL